MSTTTSSTSTTASTPGYLPAHLTLFLGTLVIAATVLFLQGLGYPPALTVGFLGIGAVVGVGIGIASADSTLRRVGSAILIWVGGIALLGAIVYTTRTTAAILATAVVPLTVYVGYGLTTTSYDTTDDATGIQSIRRTLVNIVYAGLFGGLWAAILMAPTGAIGDTLGTAWADAMGNVTTSTSIGAYLAGGILLAIAVYLIFALISRIPFDPLLDVSHIDDIDRLDRMLTRLRYGITLLIVGVTAYTAAQHLPQFSHLPDIASGLLTAPATIQLSAMVIGASILFKITTSLLSNALTTNTDTIAERYGVAILVTAAVAYAVPTFDPPLYQPLPEAVKSAPGVATIIPQTPVQSGIVMFAIASFVSVFILAIPPLLAETRFFEKVYTPIITVALGLLGLGAVMGVADAGAMTSRVGVVMIALAILVWELGEYAITATGELHASETSPTGLTTLLTTRLIPSAAVGALGVGSVFVLTTLLTGFTLGDAQLATLTGVAGTLALALTYTILE